MADVIRNSVFDNPDRVKVALEQAGLNAHMPPGSTLKAPVTNLPVPTERAAPQSPAKPVVLGKLE